MVNYLSGKIPNSRELRSPSRTTVCVRQVRDSVGKRSLCFRDVGFCCLPSDTDTCMELERRQRGATTQAVLIG